MTLFSSLERGVSLERSLVSSVFRIMLFLGLVAVLVEDQDA